MSNFVNTRSIGAVLEASAAHLHALGIETARLDVRVLMAHLLKCDQSWLLAHREDMFPAHLHRSFDALFVRRASYEPVAYLTGVKEFWSLPFRVTSDTLIPRPDSEVLVETALTLMPQDARNVIDLGTGTGCLLLALLHERPALRGLGVDFSLAALTVAEENAKALGLSERARFRIGQWSDYCSFFTGERFDFIVSNPPYIANSDIGELTREIRTFEPIGALKGGIDGLDAYREIARCLPILLAPGGYFIGEFGMGQGVLLSDILEDVGLQIEGFRKDAGGCPRCIIARKKDNG